MVPTKPVSTVRLGAMPGLWQTPPGHIRRASALPSQDLFEYFDSLLVGRLPRRRSRTRRARRLRRRGVVSVEFLDDGPCGSRNGANGFTGHFGPHFRTSRSDVGECVVLLDVQK